jgi:hemolysin activation/secretion protein
VALRGIARIGFADLVPNAELSVIRATPSARFALTGYRRLATANPDTRPFGPINSAFSFLAQRDDGEYYRTLGAELTAQNTNSGWVSARVYFQQERLAEVETNASLPHFFDNSNTFRPNIVADSATQLGGSLTLRGTHALSHAVTIGGETTVDGATGDFDFGRGSATARLFVTPTGPLAGALTASVGTSTGTVSTQGRFYLGGSGSLRGYAGGVMAGEAFWSARAELGNSFPAVRVIGFSDIGWAGDRSQFSHGSPLIGAGVGASFLDGLIRVDLARGLRAPTGWRLEIYVDGGI